MFEPRALPLKISRDFGVRFLPRLVRTDLAASLAAPFARFFKFTLLDISANKLELQVKYNSA